MKVEEITGVEIQEDGSDIVLQIEALKKGRTTELPDISEYKKQYDPAEHEVFDETNRPDKPIKNDNGELERMEKVNRLPYPLQKRIVGTAVSFAFGNPIHLKCEPENSNQELILSAINRIFHDNKVSSFNRTIGKELFRSTEVAEYWYPVVLEEAHSDYGFSTKTRIKVQAFSPWHGDELFPFFDEMGDLKAFSRAYERKITKDKVTKYFETYTDVQFIRWRQDKGSDWEIDKNIDTIIGKIPVIYGSQEEVEWADVQWAIKRLEFLLSNFADTNDYHASPKIFVEGEVTGFASKGESGAIIQGEPGSKAYYLSWAQAPEAVRLEIETLFRLIYSCTQTPDISFDSVKGLQQISGVALEMLFMDAHLKVLDKREVLDAYMQRRINVVKSFIGVIGQGLASDASKIEIEPEIIPYMVGSKKDKIETLTAANGGKPLISQKTSVEQSGLVDNVDDEWEQIQQEQEQESTLSLFEPTQS